MTSADSRSVARDGATAVAAAMTPPGQIATLILPADASWNEADGPAPLPPIEGRAPVVQEAISDVARILLSGEPAVIFLGGDALREPGLTLAGRVATDFLPYPVDAALAALADASHLVLVGSEAPVAFFAYPGKPSALSPPQCGIHTLATPGEDVVGALEGLAEELGAPQDAPVQAPEEYPVPSGQEITPQAAAAVVGALLPEGAIVVDEALTAAPVFISGTQGAAPHDLLQVTGGAIGIGLPLATGAASAGSGETGRTALDMMELDRPALDWPALARGMGVEAGRARTMEELERQLAAGLRSEGPYLIDLML